MFLDYLKFTAFIDEDEINESAPNNYGLRPIDVYHRTRILGEVDIDNCTNCVVHYYPGRVFVKIEFSATKIPVHIQDAIRRFKPYSDWNLSRMDLAENLKHVTKESIHTGKSSIYVDYTRMLTNPDAHDGAFVATWNGCTIGARGNNSPSPYCRIYNCRQEREKARIAKMARHGSFEFWRLEYELGRQCLRRFNLETFGDITDAIMLHEIYQKCRSLKGTTVDHDVEFIKYDMKSNEQKSMDYTDLIRYERIEKALEKMQPEFIARVAKLIEKINGVNLLDK